MNPDTKQTFGAFIREKRMAQRITLRDFCRSANVDPSNWSKVERGKLLPPSDEDQVEKIANTLGIVHGSSDWHRCYDLAYTEQGKVPPDIMNDDELVAKLPVFFRTIRNEKPTDAELDAFAERLRRI